MYIQEGQNGNPELEIEVVPKDGNNIYIENEKHQPVLFDIENKDQDEMPLNIEEHKDSSWDHEVDYNNQSGIKPRVKEFI